MSLPVRLILWVLSALAALVSLSFSFFQVLVGSERGWRAILGQDYTLNAAAFGGSNKESVSSHAAKAARRGERWGCVLCRLLDRVDPGHCEKSIQLDEGKPM